MNRALAITTVTGVLQFIALAISLAVVASSAERCKNINPTVADRDKTINGDAMCSTPGCLRAASQILKNMNPEIAPCDNFYEFACGGFEKSTTIPDDESSFDTYSIVENQLQEQLRASIEEVSRSDERRKPFALAKNLWNTCMNETAIEKAGLEPLLQILEQLGGWPVLEGDNWNAEEFNWIQSVHKFLKLGYPLNYFIDFSISVDLKNAASRIIYLDQASLGLDLEYLIRGMEDELVKAYYNYMVDVAVILGADRQRAALELRESLEFEIRLANISLPAEKRRNFTLLYNPMRITELNERYPSVNWEDYINNLLPRDIRVDENEIVIVAVPSFISDLEELLRTAPKRVQSNYLMWRVVRYSVRYLTEEMKKRQLKYVTALSGRRERRPRWKECLDLVDDNLPISISALYVRKYFGEDAKKTASEIVAGIGEELTTILEKTEWMDRRTKSTALKKSRSLSGYVGYPSELLDDKKLEEFYASLDFGTDDLIGSIRNVNIFQTNYSFGRLREPVNKSDWLEYSNSAIVNAAYYPTHNSIDIPAGILQGAFFSSDRPQYMNYGGIGSLIGHEVTHGFDDRGRQFDENGNLVDWWTPETEKKFLEKAECIINQYGNYTEQSVDLKLNGITTQGENIADNGGIKVAYLAYKEWVNRNGPEPKLQGLKYTPEQMFWIATANVWREKYRPEFLRFTIRTDVHSTAQFRVIGSFSNNPEFAADFNCPVGSAMNPEHKCSVW